MATDRTRRRTWTAAVLVTAILVVLYLSGGIVSGLRGVANLVVAPFDWTVSTIARPIGHLFAGVVNYSDVVSQNQKLRYELGQAQLRANQAWPLERQLQQLTTELHVPYVGALPRVAVQVTAISPTNFSATVDISKGRDSGILVGMPVVGNGGLVGTVISTTPHGATVRLITDTDSSIGVTDGHSAKSIIVTGQGVNSGLRATSVPLNTSVKTGTLLWTDGLQGGLFPPGLPVATVTSLTLTPGAATYDLTLNPSADLRHMTYLDVVQWEPST